MRRLVAAFFFVLFLAVPCRAAEALPEDTFSMFGAEDLSGKLPGDAKELARESGLGDLSSGKSFACSRTAVRRCA